MKTLPKYSIYNKFADAVISKYFRQSSSSETEEIPGLRKISATEEALVIQINMSVFRSKYDEDVSN